MKLFSRKQSISLRSLVLTLLLSFIGQAWALPTVCNMVETEASNASPCHSMMAEESSTEVKTQLAMDCCDTPTMADSSCSCPDSGCSASVPVSTQASTSSYSFNEQGNYYSQSGFPSQINSALFRPPIA